MTNLIDSLDPVTKAMAIVGAPTILALIFAAFLYMMLSNVAPAMANTQNKLDQTTLMIEQINKNRQKDSEELLNKLDQLIKVQRYTCFVGAKTDDQKRQCFN